MTYQKAYIDGDGNTYLVERAGGERRFDELICWPVIGQKGNDMDNTRIPHEQLFKHMEENHGLSLTQSEMDDITDRVIDEIGCWDVHSLMWYICDNLSQESTIEAQQVEQAEFAFRRWLRSKGHDFIRKANTGDEAR